MEIGVTKGAKRIKSYYSDFAYDKVFRVSLRQMLPDSKTPLELVRDKGFASVEEWLEQWIRKGLENG